MRKALVTGGAGFIGSYLVEKLVNNGYEVIVVDNLSRGTIKNLKSVLKNITFVNGNIINNSLMKALIKRSDIVYHLAALSRVYDSIKNPELCFRDNVFGTEVIAKLCSNYKKKLIFTSSREVYGEAIYVPVDEKHPLNPINPYGLSKFYAENVILDYHEKLRLNYVILRLSNVFGKRDKNRVIPIFIEKSLKGEPIIIRGRNKILDFVFVADVIDALIKAQNVSCEVMNIGSGKGIKLTELAEIVRRLTGSNSRIIVKKPLRGEVIRYIADINRAIRLLDWRPKVDLIKGLECIINNQEAH